MQLGYNNVSMAQNNVIISSESLSLDDSLETSSDESSGSGRRQVPTKPVISSNKSSTFPSKLKSDNKETPLKQPHQYSFTPKQANLETIKQLHIKCGFLDTENSFMLPKTCLEYQQYEDVHVVITQILHNAYCTLKKKLRKISRVRITKSTVFVIIFIFFMWPISLNNAGPRSIINLIISKWCIKKYISFCKDTMNNGTLLSSSAPDMESKVKKNRRANFKKR